MGVAVAIFGMILLNGGSTVQTRDQDEVLKANHTIIEAMAKCDLATVDRLRTDDQLTINPAGNVSTKRERGAASQPPCTPYTPATVSDTRVRMYGGDTAVVTGKIVIHGRDGKDLPEARFTAVFVKDNGVWKEASYQGTTIRETSTPPKH